MLLKFLRKRKTMKRIIWALAILIIPAFVIWGAGSSGRKSGKGPNCAGKIFNKKISFEEYVDMWRVTRDNLTRSFGRNIPPEFIDQMTWNRIILLEAAKRENITAKDSEVAKMIAGFPVFQRDGLFDKKLYKSILGDAARGFEEKLRDDIHISKLREKVTSNISVTEEEVKDTYKRQSEKIKASYVSIPFADFEKDVSYEEPDLVKFYEENKEAFRRPERINVRYIEIPFSGFDKEVYVKEDAIKRYFEEHMADFKKPDSDEKPILDEAIKSQITERLGMERKASLAEELAYKVMDKVLDKKDLDEASRSFGLAGKETGFFSMQDEVPGIGWSYEFTKSGFELEPGQISNVLIKTEKGFYIIQLKEKRESYIPEFAETRDSVISVFTNNRSIGLAEKKAKELYLAITDRIKTGGAFEDIASEVQEEIKQTAFITRDGYISALGPAMGFVEVGMSLKTEEVSEPVKMLESWVIVRLDEYEGIDEIKFIEERKDFKETLLLRKKQGVFDKWFERLKKEADFVSYTLE